MEAGISLGEAVRAAREKEGISVRELARRAGISAGQVSRIEAGAVRQPGTDTLRALATSLGRSSMALMILAGHIAPDEGAERLSELLEELQSQAESVMDEFAQISSETSSVLDAAAGVFADVPVDALSSGLGTSADASELREISSAWVSLTPVRRRLVLAFISDQEVLSRLDRMPNPPGRYAVEVQLLGRGGSDA